MNEDVFFGIGPVDKSVTALDVEPFHYTGHLGRNDFLLSSFELFCGLLLVR